MNQNKVISGNKAFRVFLGDLKLSHNTYHSKIISNKYKIPSKFTSNIENYGHFTDTFNALINNKLYIHVEPNFSRHKIFHKYILPTSAFLHYLDVDISKIPEIHLFVVNDQLYDSYRENIGGEYTDQYKSTKTKQMHLILVRDYNTSNKMYWDLTLCSLFHELMHLVDNIDFNGLNDANNVDYTNRYYEIHARYISELFLCVYKGITSSQTEYNKLLILSMWLDDLRQNLDGLNASIEHITFCNNELIELELTSEFKSSDLIIEYTLANKSFYRSLKCINTINQMFDKVRQITNQR